MIPRQWDKIFCGTRQSRMNCGAFDPDGRCRPSRSSRTKVLQPVRYCVPASVSRGHLYISKSPSVTQSPARRSTTTSTKPSSRQTNRNSQKPSRSSRKSSGGEHHHHQERPTTRPSSATVHPVSTILPSLRWRHLGQHFNGSRDLERSNTPRGHDQRSHAVRQRARTSYSLPRPSFDCAAEPRTDRHPPL